MTTPKQDTPLQGAPSEGSSAYAGFGGTVGRTFASSQPWWPPRPTAPAGAPNVVVVLCDDLGFSDISCYGSEIATPNIDAIAQPGFPGYASELADNQPSLAETMRANGYSTMMVGKWHLSKDSDMSEAGNKNS